MDVTLITSASYVSDELSAEFGRLPSAFLPVGHNRLYDLQLPMLEGPVHLTIPQSYAIPDADQDRLERSGASVLRVPDGLSLGNSVLYALAMIGGTPGAVRILHGDTIITDLPSGLDILAVGAAPEAYEWGVVSSNGTAEAQSDVLAGYFAFADAEQFRRSLTVTQGDFVAAVNDYGALRTLTQKKVSHWLDCGHLQTYYRSRCSMRIQRAFNALEISFQTVEKTSENSSKINAEAHWFESLPPPLRLHTPAFLGRATVGASSSYSIEYLPMPSLHELFVFSTLTNSSWEKILEACFQLMRLQLDCTTSDAQPTVIHALTAAKTNSRLQSYLDSVNLRHDATWRYRGKAMPSLVEIAERTASVIDMERRDFLGVMHGDLCFTNMFYDFRTQRVKVIDPRGTIDGQGATVFGDLRYDLGKLNHSIVGAYDFILADRYACSGFGDRDLSITFPKDSSFDRVNAIAPQFRLNDLSLSDDQITAITIHLFLSMLPLHADNPARQQAFVANALRLFAESFDR